MLICRGHGVMKSCPKGVSPGTRGYKSFRFSINGIYGTGYQGTRWTAPPKSVRPVLLLTGGLRCLAGSVNGIVNWKSGKDWTSP